MIVYRWRRFCLRSTVTGSTPLDLSVRFFSSSSPALAPAPGTAECELTGREATAPRSEGTCPSERRTAPERLGREETAAGSP